MTEASPRDLRAAVQNAVVKITKDTNISTAAVAAISELTYLYATNHLAPDVAAFCAHANRKTVTPADVALVGACRRRKRQNTKEKEEEEVEALPVNDTTALHLSPTDEEDNLLDLNISPINKNKKNDSWDLGDADSSSSSSDSEPLPAKPFPSKKTHAKTDALSSSSEDEAPPKVIHTTKRNDNVPDISPPVKRFRLGVNEPQVDAQVVYSQETESEDDIRPPSPKRGVRKILASLSQDSVLSE